jgi:hypothetical protein
MKALNSVFKVTILLVQVILKMQVNYDTKETPYDQNLEVMYKSANALDEAAFVWLHEDSDATFSSPVRNGSGSEANSHQSSDLQVALKQLLDT